MACGSHIDTVKNSDTFDGITGVIIGMEIVRVLEEARCKKKHDIEIMAI